MNRLTKLAKNFRKNSTDAERILWQKLIAKQMSGIKFRRQQPIKNYIVDFVSFEKRLIIELDGGQHARDLAHDRCRDRWLTAQGFTVLRFWNNDVFENIQAVLLRITEALTHPLENDRHISSGDLNK